MNFLVILTAMAGMTNSAPVDRRCEVEQLCPSDQEIAAAVTAYDLEVDRKVASGVAAGTVPPAFMRVRPEPVQSIAGIMCGGPVGETNDWTLTCRFDVQYPKGRMVYHMARLKLVGTTWTISETLSFNRISR